MKVRARDTLGVYWREVRQYKLTVFLMVFAISATSVTRLAVPLFYKKFFDAITSGTPSASIAQYLVKIVLIVFALNGVIWVGYRATSFLNNYFQPRVMADLHARGFAYLVEHSYGFFANSFAGALTQRLRRLSRAFEDFADRIYWNLYPLAFRLTGMSIVLWFVNHTITIIFVAWAVTFITFNYFFSRWKLQYDAVGAARDSEVTATLADVITNHTNLQIFTGGRYEFDRFKQVVESLRRIMSFSWNLSSAMEAVQATLVVGVEFLLFYYAIKFWQQGTLSVGTFVLIQAYLITLIDDLWDFGRQIRDIFRSFADAEEMVSILLTPHEVTDQRGASELVVTAGAVTFDRVSFSFHKTRTVLKKFSLAIAPHEKVALVGPSGAGKTTITKLLFRFYDIDGGKILIDGKNIAKVMQQSLRASVSLVPQEPILFHRTIMDNIRYGRRDATDAEVKEAARLANCQFIEELPKGYQTFVGERGIKLSGGERQRVAIARAILKNAPILVLDEATSSLDSESEALIQAALDTLMAGKTVVVIAHRLSTIRRMDRIVVIENGEVIEEGTHDGLVRRVKSRYHHLWKLQAGGFLQDE